MKYVESENTPSETIASKAWLLGGIAFLLCVGGCGGGAKNSGTSPTAPQQGPQTYFAPYVSATTNGGGGSTVLRVPQTYAIDDHADTFTQAVFGLPATKGPQVLTAGCFLSQALCTPNVVPAGQRGLLSLGITTTYANTGSAYVPTTINPAKPGSFAVELAGQAGGLVQLVGQPVAPLAASAQCPTSTTTQTWQFVTLPGALIDSAQSGSQWSTWDPTAETAYGSIDISSDGTNVSFGNIHQFTLPSVGGTGVPSQPPPSSIAGICGPSVFGNTITAPGQVVIQDPGINTVPPPQATIGIGPTGLLVEDNGVIPTGVNIGQYENIMGAGTGAVGLPKPTSALNPTTLAGAQYLGFVYGAGFFSGNASSPVTGWSSHLASFGFSNTPPGCAAVAASTSTMIYGGDFTNDDPTTSSNGFGNCDLALDLGTQDATNNGLFPKATVWLGASYAANTTGQTYSFPAVAIAGQLNGKNAIFVLGVDSTANGVASPQPWAIYLLQSN